VLDKVWGLRVSPEDELEGVDLPEMGVLAYPDNVRAASELDYDSADNAPIPQLARFNHRLATGEALVNVPKNPEVHIDRAVPVELVSQPAVTLASDVKLTKIDIITKQNKFEVLKEAMNDIGVSGMTVTQVLGCGIQKGKTEYYRGVEKEINLLPKVQVAIVVSKVPVRKVIETAKKPFTRAISVMAKFSCMMLRMWSECVPEKKVMKHCRTRNSCADVFAWVRCF